jgi:hypothetical protein
MVGFGRYLTQSDGTGGDTVERKSICQFVMFTYEKGIKQCTLLLCQMGDLFNFFPSVTSQETETQDQNAKKLDTKLSLLSLSSSDAVVHVH